MSSPSLEYSFTLKPEWVDKALSFAVGITSTNSQSTLDFSNPEINRTSSVDTTADTVEGKLAEMVFARFLRHNFDIKIKLDLRIYNDKDIIDYGQDLDYLEIDGIKYSSRNRIDVKGTRSYSKWLLIEKNKFWADAYVIGLMNLPRNFEHDISCLKNKSVKGTIAGFGYHFDIMDQLTKKPWFKFVAGSKLFNPEVLENIKKDPDWSPDKLTAWLSKNLDDKDYLNVNLKSRVNYGLPISWLRNDLESWKEFVDWVKASKLNNPNPIVPGKLITPW